MMAKVEGAIGAGVWGPARGGGSGVRWYRCGGVGGSMGVVEVDGVVIYVLGLLENQRGF